MSSSSLLLVLLVLACLQSSTMAQRASGADLCCFEFHKRPIPAANIVSVEETRSECTVPGVIFTTRRGFQICADPEVDWVKSIIESKINEKMMNSSVSGASGADLCCFEFHKRQIPAANIVSVEETRSDCTLPGVIFTTKKGFRMCVDPEYDWVKNIIVMKNPSA